MNRYDFMKAEIKAMDWTRQICPKTITQNELPECKRCYTEDTCTMSMVGFESRVARIDPSKDIDPTTSTTVLAASFIGAPTFVVSLIPFFLFKKNIGVNRIIIVIDLTFYQNKTNSQIFELFSNSLNTT